jgi:cytochrome c peroxidase
MSYSPATLFLACIAATGIPLYYLYIQLAAFKLTKRERTKGDYQEVYNEIASRLEEDYYYDDGSYGPILVRLAWHASGTYDTKTGTGGSNGATMRFKPESNHGANGGLKIAQNFLEPVKGTCKLLTHIKVANANSGRVLFGSDFHGEFIAHPIFSYLVTTLLIFSYSQVSLD